MSQVTKMISHELEESHQVKVQYVGEYHTQTFGAITSIGFSVDDDGLLLLFRGTDTELPSVVINTAHTKAIEILKED